MPRQETVTLYRFEELSEEAREKAIDNHRYINVNDEWWCESTVDEWTEGLKSIGFTQAQIYFTGFCSQGDGASFTGYFDAEIYHKALPLIREATTQAKKRPGEHVLLPSGTYLPAECFLDGTLPSPLRFGAALWDDASGVIDRTYGAGNYHHENTVRFGAYSRNVGGHGLKLVESFEEEVEEWRRSLCQILFHTLRGEYEYLTGDEAIAETLVSGEYEFTADGEDR